MHRLKVIAFIFVGLAVLAAITVFPLLAQQTATPSGVSKPGAPGTLYDHLGRMAGIDSLANDLTARVMQDSVIMANASVRQALAYYTPQRLHYLLVTGTCEVTGGPCRVAKDSLKTASAAPVNVRLTEEQWISGVHHLRATFEKFNVPEDVQNQLVMLVTLAKPKLVPQQ